MSIQFSPVIAAQESGRGTTFSMKNIDLHKLGELASPIVVFDDFRVRGRPFAPHPHAGFSAVTYVFEDSQANLRSRTSLGHDLVIGPGGIGWTDAGSGLVHEEVPAEADRELHGLQLFVNLSAKNKEVSPRVHWLARNEMPEWSNQAGDRMRVVVGSCEGVSSPLVPAEPFNMLDVELRHEISYHLQDTHNTLIYVLAGDVLVSTNGHEQKVAGEHALALHGNDERVKLAALHYAHFLMLSGTAIREPVLAEGPFIMNERSQIEAAVARYRAGGMGHLAPLSEG
jgi:redox-sensitive bicupin YhaK (pirin superfamily)